MLDRLELSLLSEQVLERYRSADQALFLHLAEDVTRLHALHLALHRIDLVPQRRMLDRLAPDAELALALQELGRVRRQLIAGPGVPLAVRFCARCRREGARLEVWHVGRGDLRHRHVESDRHRLLFTVLFTNKLF